MIGVNRRDFLSGLASCTVFAGLPVRADDGAVSAFSGKADLRFGVLSDVHLHNRGDESTLLAALEHFRDNGADAVVIAGDIADNGRVSQLIRCGECWRKVFPNDKAPDGRHVEKLFVYGNHDWYHWNIGRTPEQLADPEYARDCLNDEHRAAAWQEAFGEKYEPIWMKTVKGHVFIGAHWGCMAEMPAFLKAHADEIDRTKPFFYVQHAHPKDTCIGAWAWGHDDGASTKALAEFPNAVAFSGHSHYSLTDERSVWQGAFTSINTASLKYVGLGYSLRENASINDYGYREPRKRAMPEMPRWDGRQGMLVSVYGNTLVIGRRDFVKGKPLGDDWIVTVPGGAACSFAARRAKRSAPAFAADAKVEVLSDDKSVTVNFPPAKTVAKCRVFEYEVTATLVEDDADLVLAQRRVMARDFYLPETAAGATGSCVFSREELTWPGHYVFSVRPIECFGKKGAAITSDEKLILGL